ncbi:dynamin family protein [Streptomyces sp. NBC_01381]|uniref:dynamin family protein n=1 Tax=Streptomyces sp. NBC_01381 TaxID=2903845 RepID=UPI00224F2F8B|nr:dynamin family protein [Streptomyces sp. NBC_01381]MCX4671951.1 dynamin family protein [Streptomyces sp. NBC_01381]
MGSDMDDYAQWAVKMLEALDRAPSDGSTVDRELHAGREELRAAAAKLLSEARGPLSIGVVGEFSAGKSLLIEALLGLPGLLSVSDVATTGNVTAIHVGQSKDDDRGSSLKRRAVVYCTAAEVAELMAHLYGKLEELAPLEGLPGQRLEALRAARPGPSGWEPLVEWCGRFGSGLHGARMRSVAAEVELLHTAHEIGAPMLGRRYDLSDAQAKRAMSLPGVKLEEGGSSRALPTTDVEGHRIPDDVLAACVPLIRRVELRVGVPPGIWDLEGVGALTLMDFPGLNSPESGERDRFLSRRELRDIHTVLVLMNGQRGPVANEQDFFDMLREPTADGRERRPDKELRESLLVAGGRFDQMPVDQSALKAALLDSAEPLKEQRLRGLPDTAVLDKIVEAAQRLLPVGQRKQLVLLSAMVGLDRLARSPGVRVDEDLRARLLPGVEERTQITELWAKVGARLEADDPGSSLSTALREFAHDGGIDLLRRQFTRHAKKYGGAIRDGAVKRRAVVVDRLRVALAGAEQAARPEAAYPPEYGEIQRTLDETRRLLEDLRNGLVLGIGPDSSRSDDALRQRIADEAATLVSGWPQWKELFTLVDREKLVVKARHADRPEDDQPVDEDLRVVLAELGLLSDDADPAADPASSAPHAPADLLPQFRTSYSALLSRVHDEVRASYEERLDQHVDSMDELFDRWVGIAREQTRGPRPKAHQDRLTALIKITHAQALRTRLRQAAAAQLDPGAVDRAYPLRLDRCFPWHPDAPDRRDQADRHVVHSVRMRRELIMALLHLVYGQLAKEQAHLAATAGRFITDLERIINTSDTFDLLVSSIRADEEARRTGPLELAARLEGMSAPGSRRGAPSTETTRPQP